MINYEMTRDSDGRYCAFCDYEGRLLIADGDDENQAKGYLLRLIRQRCTTFKRLQEIDKPKKKLPWMN